MNDESFVFATQVNVNALEMYVDCPYCKVTQEGFLDDPRGGEFECESCGMKYKVNPAANINIM